MSLDYKIAPLVPCSPCPHPPTASLAWALETFSQWATALRPQVVLEQLKPTTPFSGTRAMGDSRTGNVAYGVKTGGRCLHRSWACISWSTGVFIPGYPSQGSFLVGHGLPPRHLARAGRVPDCTEGRRKGRGERLPWWMPPVPSLSTLADGVTRPTLATPIRLEIHRFCSSKLTSDC